jgi:hypothetical protein
MYSYFIFVKFITKNAGTHSLDPDKSTAQAQFNAQDVKAQGSAYWD